MTVHIVIGPRRTGDFGDGQDIVGLAAARCRSRGAGTGEVALPAAQRDGVAIEAERDIAVVFRLEDAR